jgi:hypothetical protein
VTGYRSCEERLTETFDLLRTLARGQGIDVSNAVPPIAMNDLVDSCLLIARAVVFGFDEVRLP